MTTVDSQTIVSLDTPVLVFSDKKDEDIVQAEVLNVISEELETLSDCSDPLVYFRKGDGRRPVTGGLKANQAAKHSTSSSSSKNTPPAKRPVATNPPKTSHLSSKDKAKK